ncbi:MAG: aminotransferase class I/II-fold pyridoxal phosphate-dependent enzyme [Chloroflexota bacterium]
MSKTIFTKDLSTPDPIPDAGIERAVQLMQSGRLHRYGEVKGEEMEVMALEREFADYMGMRYAVGLNSCGCALFVALKSAGVQHGDKVLMNAFTLAPVPGSIAHCGAEPVLVEVSDDYTIDLDDLRIKATESGAKYLMLSHMRGHIVDMEALSALCQELGLTVIEDCAHTMGASWNGRWTGTFGAVSCFSTQTFKHINSGEGGLLVTNDEDIAAKAILYSGSYMLYHQHGARPEPEVFDRWKAVIPNFSMRMSSLSAAMLRPQLALMTERGELWNQLYTQLAERFAEIPHIQLPERGPSEQFVASSIQFTIIDLADAQMIAFQEACDERGVHLKWFGRDEALGFTSRYPHWAYRAEQVELPQTDHVMRGLFDMRIPLNLTEADVELIALVMCESMETVIQ